VQTDSWNSDDLTDRAEEIFCAALEVTSLAERGAFVRANCGQDAELLATVEAMLNSQPEVDNFFKRSMPSVTPDISQAITDACGLADNAVGTGDDIGDEGKRIGPYRLLQKIGEGGCGVVYLAEQQAPVRRRVALKVIKLGMDTKRVIARFEAERQALALMDHPHIARVLDAGATETGRPYFVMELVHGKKITRYCDEHCLDLHDRLSLFIQVCNAIQHAHQKGIVHRDIKPSNILVMNHDGVPVPKVIDFGIAKATSGEPLTDKTLFTAFEQFVGTPAYMSPEQAEMGNMDVDTRSDIYSLGVLLYELLTGKTPFEQNELLESGLDQMRRTLRECEPHRPSAKLKALDNDELTETALLRRVEPRKLKSLLTGDLDWIVMKALEKDRSLRYQTANGLGVDAQHYLNNEPVVARPPNRFYRFRKLVRRNKGLFVMIGTVSLALVSGFGTSSWLFVKEREARREQVVLREEAERARASESRRRVEAETSAKIAEAAVLITRKRVDEADHLIDGIEISSVQPSLEAASVFRDLGCWNVTQGRWEQAAKRFLKKQQLADAVDTSDLTDNATRDMPAIAIALIVANHLDDYRQLIRGAAIHFAKTDNPVAAEHVLKISTYLPGETNTLKLLEPFERVAEKSLVDEQSANTESQCMLAWRAIAVAMYYYRHGDFSPAIYWSRRCLNYTDTAATRAAMAHAVLAMAEHRVNSAEGAAELEAARAIVDTKFPDHRIDVSGVGNDSLGFWNDWITALLLYQEADLEIHPGIGKVKH
jgi:serine/threonine protein kinase